MVIGLVLYLNSQLEHSFRQNARLMELIHLANEQRPKTQLLADKSILLLDSTLNTTTIREDLKRALNQVQFAHDQLTIESFGMHGNPHLAERIDSLLLASQLSFDSLIHYSLDLASASEEKQMISAIRKVFEFQAEYFPTMELIGENITYLAESSLTSTGRGVSVNNYLSALAVLISAGSVLFLTLQAVKKYSVRLEQLSGSLTASLKSEQHKVERLEFLTKSINVGVWEKSMVENTESWSEVLYAMLGYEKHEIEGTGANFMKLVHPTDLQKLVDASDSSIRTGLSNTLELRIKTKSGDYKWVEATGNVKKDPSGQISLFIGGVIDIDGRKKLEMQLKAFIERAPASIAMFDNQMNYLAVSHRWIQDYGLQSQVIIGKSHYEIFPELGEDWRAIHQRCLQGSVETSMEDEFVRADGSSSWLKWEVRPWYIDDETIGGVLMFTEDVTDNRKKREELQAAKVEAEMASKAKEDFLAAMSHEIRTPLNAINGISHILLLEDPKPEQLDHLNLLKFSGENLLSLINDILDISKIESGKFSLHVEPFDFYYLVDNVKKALSYRAKDNLVKIETHYDDLLPRGFEGDDTRLTQILYNLVGNAIKFTESGKVSISVNFLKKQADMYTFRVSVIDTGIGISEENIRKIFASFEQAEGGTTRKYGGTGLGLYITKRLLQYMNSEIFVESIVGKGSHFYFELTLKGASLEFEDIDRDVDVLDTLRKKNMSILVAEDNAANQLIIEKFLKEVTSSYTVVSDGEKALDQIKNQSYDLVLMDLQMPTMDGFEATAKIRQMDEAYFTNIPIVALTADAFLNVRERALAIGMSDYLSKPFKPSDLYQILLKYSDKVQKQERRESSIHKIIHEYAEGDKGFVMEFANRCRNSYDEFLTNIQQVVERSDMAELGRMAHKIKGLNGLFKLDELQDKIESLRSNGVDLDHQQALLDEISMSTRLIIQDLEEIC